MFKIAICDDEKAYRKKLIQYLNDNESIKNQIEIYEYKDGKNLLSDIEQFHDLFFLDIQMKELDGEETAKAIRSENKNAVLVFCTNYNKLTRETIKVQPFRYIVKDIYDKELKAELPAIIDEMLLRKQSNIITIVGDGSLYRIDSKEILYISVRKRGTQVFIYRGSQMDILMCKKNLKEMYLETKQWGFEYAHNSYIINLENIVRLEKNVVTLKGGIELNISRSKKKQFDSHFSDFLRMRYRRK